MTSEAPKVAVAIMAKAPRAGAVKTRLCPPLSLAEAADLSRGFLLDKIIQVRALPDARPTIAFTPGDERALFEALAPDFLLVPQQGVDLGIRLYGVLDGLVCTGYAAALAIDSDTPTLPTEFLEQAVHLATAPDVDVVLGPTEDGGYYLVGGRRAHRELFAEMPWSTSRVFEETMRRAATAGLRVACLPPWFDVDTPADLSRLRAFLAARRDGTAKETRRLLGLG